MLCVELTTQKDNIKMKKILNLELIIIFDFWTCLELGAILRKYDYAIVMSKANEKEKPFKSGINTWSKAQSI